MGKIVPLLCVLLLFFSLSTGSVIARNDGMFNQTNNCNCHNSGSVTPSISGLPSAYTAGDTYALTIGMSGTPATGGFNLKVSKGVLSTSDSHAQISSNSFQATHTYSPGTTSWSIDWKAPATGSGNVQFNLAVLAGNNNGNDNGDMYATMATTLQEAVATNNPPVIAEVILLPANPTTLDDLTVSYTFTDDDGDAEVASTFSWYLNDTLQAGYTNKTLPSIATTRGQSWHVIVTPSDGIDAGTPVASFASAIMNSAPIVSNITMSPFPADTEDDLTFTFSVSDPDGDNITQTETRWRLDGEHFGSFDNVSTLPALATRKGDVWDVQVKASDGNDTSAWFTSASVLIGANNAAPTLSSVSLTPSTQAYTTDDLLLTWVANDANGDEIHDVEMLWYNNGVHQQSFDDLNPLPAQSTQKGQEWMATLRVFDGIAWSEIAQSNAISIVNSPPSGSNASLSSPSSSAADDITLVLEMQDSDGDEIIIEAIKWYRNGLLSSQANQEATLNASLLARGDTWHAVVTITDAEDAVDIITSEVIILNAVPSIQVTWPSSPTSLEVLEPNIIITDADGDEASVKLDWLKNGFMDSSLSNSAVVPAEKLAPEQEWTVVVSVSDGFGGTQHAESTTRIINIAPQAVIELRSTHVWVGEAVLLSAANSSDVDGNIVAYTWSWGTNVVSGADLTLVENRNRVISLSVLDDNGASSSTTFQLELTSGPVVQNILAVYDEGEIQLSWTWNGENAKFNIYRNGEFVGVSDSLSYTDTPPMSGSNVYTIQPFDDERIYLNAASSVSKPSPVLSFSPPGGNSILGDVLGLLLLTVMVVIQVYRLRQEGE